MTATATTSATDLANFLAAAEKLASEFATLTGAEPTAQLAESLVTLREAGALALTALRAATSDAPRALIEAVDGPITDLVATAGRASLADHILWGNVASVIASSAEILANEEPDLRDRAHAIATEALQRPRLADAWTGVVGSTFRRTTCCQVTARGERPCGDCVRG